MFLSRASILSICVLSLGGAVALASQTPLFSHQTIAQNPAGQMPQGRGQFKLMEQLNLSQDQKQKLKDIQSQYKDTISQRKQAVRQATKELRDMMAGDAKVEDIRTKHKQVQGLRQQLEESTFDSMLAMREVLTSEQRKRFAQLMEQRHQNPRNRRGNSTRSTTS